MKLHDFIMNMIRFEESQLILLGGRPAMGKTAFVNSIMAELARNNKCSAFASLEMSEKMWIERMHRMGICDDLLEKIDVFEQANSTLDQIEETIQKKYDLIVIDYLQLVNGEDSGSIGTQRKLAELCKKCCCPIIVLSQISRAVETRDAHIPQLSDLKEKVYATELYDEIWFIYRESYYDRNGDESRFTVFRNNEKIQFHWNAVSWSVE